MDKAEKEKLQKSCALMDEAKTLIDEVQTSQQEAYDDKPEGWQESEKGQEAQGVIDNLGEQSDALEGVKSAVGEMC